MGLLYLYEYQISDLIFGIGTCQLDLILKAKPCIFMYFLNIFLYLILEKAEVGVCEEGAKGEVGESTWQKIQRNETAT